MYGSHNKPAGYSAAGTKDYVKTNANKLVQIYAGVPDVPWTKIPLKSGFAAPSGEDPMICIHGGVVHVDGIISNTGMSANGTYLIAELDEKYWPRVNTPLAAGTQGGGFAGTVFYFMDGRIQIRTGPTVSSYYSMASASWLAR